jgi:hypothetical protein
VARHRPGLAREASASLPVIHDCQCPGRVASGRESRVPVSGEWRVASGEPEWRVVATDAGEWRVERRLRVASGVTSDDSDSEWRVERRVANGEWRVAKVRGCEPELSLTRSAGRVRGVARG